MSETTLERLARAACVLRGFGGCNEVCDGCLRNVRAVVEAMRKPTSQMLDAALGHLVASNEQEEYLIACQRRDDERTWQAIIHYILSEGNT